MVGQKLDRYRLLEKIGTGGMGEVYRARDERLQRDVALKLLPPGTINSTETRQRFRQEALTLSRLNHPHVATVHDFDTFDGIDFLVMEYVAGASLSDRLAQGPLLEKEIVKVSSQVALALSEAHERGVVHRDLKPGNVVVTPKGQAKVLDFGLAKLMHHEAQEGDDTTTGELTDANVAAGTLPYMAPEQLSGETVDARTDIYALGTVIYEMATGQRPFREVNTPKMIDAILHQAPVPPRALNPRISTELERIVLKCLEKEPDNRYQSALEVSVDLRRLESSASALAIAQVVPRRRQKVRTAMRAVFGVGAVLAAVLALNLGGLRDRWLGSIVGTHVESVAVLPLSTVPVDPEQEFFADGMTDALIAELANISALRVISRTSMMHYKGTSKRIPEIGRELKVDAVLEASVLRSGDRVRITARLIRASSDTQIWGNSYERDLRDVLALQREVASAVAREIRVAVTPRETERLARASPVDPDAYVAYLKGRYHWDKRTRDDLSRAIELFRQAIAKDPAYAPAYVGLADSYLVMGSNAMVDPDKTYPPARAAALRALELDGSLADAHTSLATIYFFHYEWTDAEQEYRRAVAINPNYAIAHHWYALFLSALGRHQEAIQHIKRAQELDPLSLSIHSNAGWCYYLARQYDLAIENLRKATDLDPNAAAPYGYLAQIYIEKGMAREAIASFQKALQLTGPDTNYEAELANAYAVFGQRTEALRLLETLKNERNQPVLAYDMALVYAGLGDKDQVFAWLDKSFNRTEARLVNVKAHPRFEAYHTDSRFAALLKRLKLSD